MFRQFFLIPTILIATAAGLRAQEPSRADAQTKQDADVKTEAKVQIEPRGPVHEAFAIPFERDPKPAKPVKKQPPAPIAEEPPDQRPAGSNVQWIPGYWAWDAGKNDFVWVSGMWRNVPDNYHWVPGFWSQGNDGWVWSHGHWAAAGEQDFQFVPTPPQSRETFAIGNPPDATSFYVPGTWFYTADGWNWRDGYWSEMRPGYVWTPAQYYWTPQGYIFSNGYWDYSPLNRGLLFAPAYFPNPGLLGSGYVYQPSYALGSIGLLDSLFVNTGLGQYFFGNWFGNQYSGLGFMPWLTYGARGYDPLYNYVSLAAPVDRTLAGVTLNALQANLQARQAGQLALPPTTLADALRLNTAAAATGNRAAIRNLALLAPLTELSRVSGTNLALQPVTVDQRQIYRASVQRLIRQSVEMDRELKALRGGIRTSGYINPNVGASVQGSKSASANQTLPGTTIPAGTIPGVQQDLRINPGGHIQTYPGSNRRRR